VRFIFLHTPHPDPQGEKEDGAEKVGARNSQRQDDKEIAPRGRAACLSSRIA